MSNGVTDDNSNYFYFKAGYSNCLLPYGRVWKSSDDCDASFWVGYGEFENTISNKKIRSDLRDLIEIANNKDNREKNIIFIFGTNRIYFWKIVSNLKLANENNKDDLLIRLITEHEIEKKSKGNAKNMFTRETGQTWESSIKGKTDTSHFGAKLFDVKLIAAYERDNILPTANSLAVYQSFSRGTFRSLSAIGKDRESILKAPMSQIDDHLKSIDKLDVNENLYGRFFRIYFDWILSKDDSNSAFLKCDDKKTLLFATLNPVQLEAAAALMCMDLGLIVDFFTANSIDFIDVRGRLENNLDSDCTEVIRKLNIIMKSSNSYLSVQTEKRIRENFSVVIQCKDYDYNSKLSHGVILFKPSENAESIEDVITLSGLQKTIDNNFEEPKLINLQKWINKLEKLFFTQKPIKIADNDVFEGEKSEFISGIPKGTVLNA